jgi:hypothetical protein
MPRLVRSSSWPVVEFWEPTSCCGPLRLWGYYEKWSAAMVSLLMEQNVIGEPELRRTLFGPTLVLVLSQGPVHT